MKTDIHQKVEKFIKYCNSISEFDKYFWLSKLDKFEENVLHEIYQILLQSESKLLFLELNSIGKIRDLLSQSYPTLKNEFLPDYQSLMNDYEITQKELSIEKIMDIRTKLAKIMKLVDTSAHYILQVYLQLDMIPCFRQYLQFLFKNAGLNICFSSSTWSISILSIVESCGSFHPTSAFTTERRKSRNETAFRPIPFLFSLNSTKELFRAISIRK